jgi:hypothetical protein
MLETPNPHGAQFTTNSWPKTPISSSFNTNMAFARDHADGCAAGERDVKRGATWPVVC